MSILLILQIGTRVSQLTDVEEPRAEAILEMQINAGEAARALLDYVRDGTPQHRVRIRDSETEFEKFARKFERLAHTETEHYLGQDFTAVTAIYKDLKTLSSEVTQLVERQAFEVQTFRELFRAIDELIDEDFQAAIQVGDTRNADAKLLAALELEVEINEARAAIEGYIASPSAALRAEAEDSEATFSAIEAEYRMYPIARHERKLLDRLHRNVSRALELGQTLMADSDKLLELLTASASNLQVIDEIFDRRIQPLIYEGKTAATESTKRSADIAVKIVVIMAILGITVGWFLAGFLERSSRRSETVVHKLAYHDTLTDLGNRTHLQQRVNQSIEIAQSKERSFALLFFDLDGFKDINDSLGHQAGDELLQAISERLRQVIREMDFAARLGGDEFCLLIEDLADDHAAGEVAMRCLKNIAEPIVVASRTLQPSASVGITFFPRDGQDYDSLLKTADCAMYAAKQAGKNQYAFYNPQLTIDAERRMTLAHDLRRSLQLGEFELHYQPQVGLHRGHVVGVEALIRWRHPERGLVPPSEFVGVAERIGVIEELGEWVLRTACRQASEWRASGLPSMRVAVNISGLHFRDGRIVETVREVLEETGHEATQLELEITESSLQAGDHILDSFNRLRELGVTIAIDDFGTGYSCLSSLENLPIDCVKVDQAFTGRLLANEDYSVIVATIIAMAHAMRLNVVAEGVETLEQVQYLSALGCDVAQGYYFSKPVLSSQIPELIAHEFLPKSERGSVVEFPKA